MIKSPYNYHELKRKSVDGKRLYSTPDGAAVPSVTTILDRTKSEEKKQALLNWKRRVGEKKAQEIVTEAAGRGTRMHKWLEDYVITDDLGTPGSNPYSQQSHKMAQIIVEQGLCNASEYWGTEVPLYFPQVYAGTTDCVGVFNSKPAIIDFKQTNKPKRTEWIEDYFLQLCAYGEAHNEVYGTDIQQGVILMCSKDFEYQTWTIEGDQWDMYKAKWWDRVATYYGA
jgi:genome maintenance exonuclease 1